MSDRSPKWTAEDIARCIRRDNGRANLLICSISYHVALHARMRRDPYWREVEATAKAINATPYHE